MSGGEAAYRAGFKAGVAGCQHGPICSDGDIPDAEDAAWAAFVRASNPPAAASEVVREALRGIADDYMTSEAHHPGYVLIPAAMFEQLRAASEAINEH